MIEEKIKIRCSKCSQVFRERAGKVRDGFQINCQHCNRLITFDTNADDKNIRKALMNAREVRRAIEAEQLATRLAQGSSPSPVMDRSQY
jgi:hypothetical protein